MGRVSDIAAMHNKFISIAVGQDGRVYVWGKISCNKCITIPCVTPFSNVYNALACFANVMHEPLILYSNEESNILKHLELAFDDPVCFIFLSYLFILLAYICFRIFAINNETLIAQTLTA